MRASLILMQAFLSSSRSLLAHEITMFIYVSSIIKLLHF